MLESKSGVPLYRQLKRVLNARISQGEWKPGELFPSEKELETQFRVSRTTVRLALRELDYEGLITRHRGRGTFVSEPKVQHRPGNRGALADTVVRLGKTASWVLLEAGIAAAPEPAASALGEEPDARLLRVVRLRMIDGAAIGYLVSYVAANVPVSVDHGTLTKGDSLSYLDGTGLLTGGAASRRIDAAAAGNEVARHLDIAPGAPVLRIRRTVTSGAGAPVEFLSAEYRGDRFEYTMPDTLVDGR